MAWPKGVPKSAETRERISAALTGKVKSDEHKARIRDRRTSTPTVHGKQTGDECADDAG
jgi:hypothetical protein